MKKLFALLLAATMFLTLAACSGGSGAAKDPTADMTLTEIAEKLNEGIEIGNLTDTEITEETFNYFLFIDYIDGAEALASEPMIGSIAHSARLLRLPEDTDAATVAADIEQNADPRKWICVEAEKVVVEYSGSLVMLVMSDETNADVISANFDALCK